jgi:hypothetical protein
MELIQFMEKFLPNCEERYKETETIGQYLYFYHRNFPEALEIFVDKICEEQREICRNYYNNNQSYETHENYIANLIAEAEQPKIEEL